eukprot:SAG31_NODE_795_length_12036_cov_28.879953_1_plen_233_part_00
MARARSTVAIRAPEMRDGEPHRRCARLLSAIWCLCSARALDPQFELVPNNSASHDGRPAVHNGGRVRSESSVSVDRNIGLRWLTFYNMMLNGALNTHSNVVTNEHIGMLADWSSKYGVRGILDVHRPGNSSSCGDHCELFVRSKSRFNFSAPGLQGGGLRADWKRDLGWSLDQAMPLIRSKSIVGVFLGDEPCCSGAASAQNLSTVAQFLKAKLVGTGAFVCPSTTATRSVI